MKTISDYIQHVHGKPHHVRKRIAFASAAAGAGVIALVWLVGSLSLGNFAIRGSSFAESAGQLPPVHTGGATGIAGAAAALPSEESAPARIDIVDTKVVPPGKKAEQTILSF